MRNQIREENPHMKICEVSKQCSVMWNILPAEERKPFEDRARAARAEFENTNNLPATQDAASSRASELLREIANLEAHKDAIEDRLAEKRAELTHLG